MEVDLLTSPQECISVEKVHLHENYNSFNIQNDICMLVLQTKVNNIEFIIKHLQTKDKVHVIENMV